MTAAASLWDEADSERWKAALDSYPSVVARQGSAGLPDLDRWYRTELPSALGARQPAYVEMAEMIHVAEWKMKRGEWRARNLALIRSNPDVLVRTASAEAFSAVDDDRRPIDLLSRLAGVGPATASAVLAARAPDRFPFLDEDVAEAVPGLGPCRFTLPYYIRYAQALRDRARQLGRPWTAQEVGLALWAVRGGKAARR